MKAVGTNPLERYVGPGDGRAAPPTAAPTTKKINPAAPAAGSIPHAQDHLKPGLDFGLIGWSVEVGPDLWQADFRSEERRVGKECRSRWSPYH